jgi:hypothetical protein
MTGNEAHFQISDDKKGVSITFLPASGVSGRLNLTLDQLTALIHGLGRIRCQMVAGQEIPDLEGQAIETAINTRWHIQPEPMTEGTALLFYHPAFGALGYLVPRDQIPLMVRRLADHLHIQPTTPGKPN